MLHLLLASACLQAATYYVAPNGKDTNPGSIELPFESINRATQSVVPGDTVYIRGGTYVMRENQIAQYKSVFAFHTLLDKSGTSTARINYFAYPNEKPIFDFSNVKPANYRVYAFEVTGSWIHIKGLEVIGVQVTITTHTQSICFENNGSNNIYEQLSMHDNQAIGIYSVKGSNNLFLNCDAYNNWDYTSENGKGGNVDGFGYHGPAGSTGNIFRGCRAWLNSDDGFDCINGYEAVTFENCWAFNNGKNSSGQSLGDGHGFKAGGYGAPFAKIPATIPRHVVQYCVSVNNKSSGFYANHHPGGINLFNNTAYKNAVNFNMLGRLLDNTADAPGYDHILKNNLGFAGRREIINFDESKSSHSNNYFDLPVNVNSDDFVNLEETELTRPRVDGMLPKTNFLRLKRDSDLIDRGTAIPGGVKTPDLGAIESSDGPAQITNTPRPNLPPKIPPKITR